MCEMRMAMLLYGVGFFMLGVLGCKHPPELKPPPTPEVLASPGDADKRYTLPCSYPSDVMGDPKGLNNGVVPLAANAATALAAAHGQHWHGRHDRWHGRVGGRGLLNFSGAKAFQHSPKRFHDDLLFRGW